MITKQTLIDRIEVLPNGTLQIREATRILEDGVQLSQSFHRHCLHPGATLTNEDPRVVEVAEAVWTPQVIQDYQEALEDATI